MRKLVAWNLMSLDGYFEGETPWDLSFHSHAWGPELQALSEQFGEEGDLLVFGRKTYEGMAAYWPSAEESAKTKNYMNGIAKLVASKTITSAEWNNSRVTGDPIGELQRLKSEDGRTIFIFGSAELVASLMKHDLVDEYRICIAPVLLGRGNRLFKESGDLTTLTLTSCTPASNGAVILRYEIVKSVS